MKLNYYPESDSLYIDLSEKSSVETKEISEGILLDYDAAPTDTIFQAMCGTLPIGATRKNSSSNSQ